MTFRIADSPTALRIHALTCAFPAHSALGSTGTCVARGHYGYYVTYNDRLCSPECLPSEGVSSEVSEFFKLRSENHGFAIERRIAATVEREHHG